jgi:hypothetical protein
MCFTEFLKEEGKRLTPEHGYALFHYTRRYTNFKPEEQHTPPRFEMRKNGVFSPPFFFSLSVRAM